jgi:TonB family protein
MSFFLDTQETSHRFDNEILELRSLLDTNHISHGSPDKIFEFAKTLENSNQFRLDLSAMVKSFAQKKNEEILLTDMMSILVTTVGGPSFASAHVDITKPTNILMEFLLGTGCWKQFGLSSSSRPPMHAEEPRHTQPPSPTFAAAISSEKSESRTDLIDASSELRQMLTRIEINTQHVKRHLDSIEQRISSIEPPPEDLLTQIPSLSASLPRPNSSDIVSPKIAHPLDADIPVFEPELPTRNRAVFSQQSQQPEINDFPSPTFAYATEKRRGVIPFGVFLALLVIIAVSLFFVYSRQGHVLSQAGIARLKTVPALFRSTPATVPHAPPAASPPTSPPSAPIAATPAPPSPAAPVNNTTTPTPPAAPDSTDTNTSSDAQPISANPKIRYVPSNVMEGYLLSAPRPEYPPLARIHHIEGSVALQATISRTGSIETLHVIKGPQSLRGAAVNAVRNWRYKPYSTNGRPMEIATTVYVDFTLKPLPATAR